MVTRTASVVRLITLSLCFCYFDYYSLYRSACTCPGGDHPGPSVSKGRGAPEIDVLEAQKNKLGDGGKVSQSAQFAPFSHDYWYDNSTTDDFSIQNEAVTQANTYVGSALQQAVSALTDLPVDIFNGSGGNYYTFGFEYWADPSNRDQGFITWQSAGQQTLRVGANAVADDPLPDGSGVSRRLIPEEPMVSITCSKNVDSTSYTYCSLLVSPSFSTLPSRPHSKLSTQHQ